MPIKILNASWEAYDKRKIQNHQDPLIFHPEELWEFNYLLDNIVAAEPSLDSITVMLAIRQAMRETVAPRPRTSFVEKVVESIRERQNQWARLVNGLEQDAA